MELFIDIAAILCNIGFVVGSYCFASPSNTVYAFGDWLFISGSVFHVAHSLHDLVEQVRALKLKHPVKDHSRDEVMETTNFLISGSCFLVGCVFFLPGLENNPAGNYMAAGVGAWLCIAGSLGVVFATFYSAIGFTDDKCEPCIDPDWEPMCRKLTRQAMFLCLIGGLCFTIGSFMYRPVFGGQCTPRSTDLTCIAVKRYGTFMYLAGSYCFLFQSIILLVCNQIKHRCQMQDKETLVETTKLNA